MINEPYMNKMISDEPKDKITKVKDGKPSKATPRFYKCVSPKGHSYIVPYDSIESFKSNHKVDDTWEVEGDR